MSSFFHHTLGIECLISTEQFDLLLKTNTHKGKEFLDLANNFGGNLRVVFCFVLFFNSSVQSCCHSAWEDVLVSRTGYLGLSLAHSPVGLYLLLQCLATKETSELDQCAAHGYKTANVQIHQFP